MARSVKFTKVEGLEDLSRAIEALKDRVSSDEVKNILLSGGFVIRNEARALVPVKSGLLKENIIATRGKGKTDQLDVLVGVKYGKGGAPHAHLVEFGTSHMEAQPFFRPAVISKKKEAGEIIAAALKKLIEEKN